MSRRKPAGTTTQRGYGNQHHQQRQAWVTQVALGVIRCARTGLLIPPPHSPCPRCGKPMHPTGHAGRGWCGWDLGHLDGSGKRIYTGPELSCANRATKAHAKRRGLLKRISREW